MRALVALIIVAAVSFVGLGTYFTYQRQRQAERARQMTVLARRAQAADRAAVRAARSHAATMPEARFDPANPAHGLLFAEPLAFEPGIVKLVTRYAGMDAAARGSARSQLSDRDRSTLLRFAERAAVFGMRSGSVERCVQGWTAIAMLEVRSASQGSGLPPHDLLVAIGILDHATRKLTKDVGTRIETARALASPAVATLLGDYARRDEATRGLASCMYAELEVGGKIGLVRRATAKYAPRHDLAKIGLAVAASLDRSQFSGTDITIAEALPSTWLEAGEQAALEPHLVHVRGTVAIRATPLGHTQPENHEFAIFLSETANAADRVLLTHAVRGQIDGGVATAIGVEDVFCLIVSRSLVMHGSPLHSAQDLESIATRLGAVLSARLSAAK